MPKRKPLPPLKDPKCVCGHAQSNHRDVTYRNPRTEKLEKDTECLDGDVRENPAHYYYCKCKYFLDRRHCKIKWNDPAFKYVRTHPDYIIQMDLVMKKICTNATASRRIDLFELLGFVKRAGFAPIGDYSARAVVYEADLNKIAQLQEEGIIV